FLKIFSIGKSILGKELFCISWGKGEKRIFLNGAHHAMEWITSLLLLRMMEEFSFGYKNDVSFGSASFQKLFHEITLVMCPMVNPDGVNLEINGLTDDLPPLTKTRLMDYNGGSKSFAKWQANIRGVDLNHNYDAGFYKGVFMQQKLGIYGPAPTRYSGTEPESEPEVQAICRFTRSFLPHIAVAYHTQGKQIYYDFEAKATEKARQMVKQLAEISGYQPDTTDGMASYSGYKDWVINEFYIPAFTIEAGLGENPLPLSQFDAIYDDNLKMLLHLVQM
ncbi:MAG: M14 family metallocarboxypeptidase, partial [Clostridia bacterium]|nr:M14 family metallocarboxypeptidase [Clostridia bacterium]